ncbi:MULTISPECIES: phage holin family protein [unclassified Streptomyces]|uniref:phage holin family protein n=1 Tax=unclassified Streptomyces TaxID=2593676 RepID=UPI00058770E3|nr:phage holin family protein [Streptomyces sp. NRRL S-118]
MSDPAGNGAFGAAGTDRSLGQLVASATTELSALVHDEIALAKAELRQDVKRGAMGGAVFSIAGVFALFSLPVLSFAAAYGIHNLGLGLAWSFLIVGSAYLVLAGLLALLAVSKFKKVKPPERSIASAKRTAAVLGNAKPHPRPEAAGGPVRPALPVKGEAEGVARSSA